MQCRVVLLYLSAYKALTAATPDTKRSFVRRGISLYSRFRFGDWQFVALSNVVK